MTETPTDSPLEPWSDSDTVQVDDAAETVNYAYTVTDTPGGAIGPDPDVPVTDTPTDSPLEPWSDSDTVQVDDYAEPVNYSYTETNGIGPDPDVPTDTTDTAPLDSL